MASDTPKALIKRSSEAQLMPPPPPPKRIKRPSTVLDEDVYTDALSHIIARDYFPGLLETQTQQEYLAAINSKDREWIAEAGKKLEDVMTPGPQGRRARVRTGVSMTPSSAGWAGATPSAYGGETPISVAGSDVSSTQEERKPQVDLSLSLSSFQARYTSEDNESFNALVDRQNVKTQQDNAWLWHGNKIPTARQLTYDKAVQKALASSSDNSASTALIQRPSQDLSLRSASLDQKSSNPRNGFMFTPTALEDAQPHLESRAAALERRSNAPPKQTNAANTRLRDSPPPSASAVPPSPSLSAINDALAGRPRPTESDVGYTGSETPRVNGYAFVDAEPPPPSHPRRRSPSPEDERALLAKLGPVDSSPNPFTISSSSRRETLHHKLVDKHSKAKREGAGGGGRLGALKSEATPRFMSSPVQKGNLTPAAQKLLDRMGKTPRREGDVGAYGGFGGTEKGDSKTWTPTPRVKRG